MGATIKVTIEIPDEALDGILSTFVEGGLYWARGRGYRWNGCPAEVTLLPASDYVGLKDGTRPVRARHHVTRATIARGLCELASARTCKDLAWNAKDRGRVLGELRTDPATPDLDASDADCIVQLGLFGRVVFG